MVATMTPPQETQSKPRPVNRAVEARKVPITVKPNAEERAQLRRDRISAAFALLFIVAMVAALVWAAMTGDASTTDVMLDFPPMF